MVKYQKMGRSRGCLIFSLSKHVHCLWDHIPGIRPGGAQRPPKVKNSAQLFHCKICDAALEKSELKGTGDQFGSVLNWEGRAGRGSSTRGVRKVCLEVQQLQHFAILYFISPMYLK